MYLEKDIAPKSVLPKYIKLTKHCTSAEECGFAKEIKTVQGNAKQTSSILGKALKLIHCISHLPKVSWKCLLSKVLLYLIKPQHRSCSTF